MFENSNRTEISNLGEYGFIEHITSSFKNKNLSTILGIGDDAAVIEKTGEEKCLFSSELWIENIHFDLSYFPLKHLGYKIITASASDIVAMNGVPTQVIVSIAFSNRFSLESMEELYNGIQLACDKYKIDLVGGDTTSAHGGLTIGVTVVGLADSDKITYRKGAQNGDLICVSGDLGAAYTGLQYLLREKKIFMENPGVQPDFTGKDYVLERQLKPELRLDIISFFKEKQIVPTSMIDLSDGVTSDLHQLCRASGVGAIIYEDKIPIDTVTYNSSIEIGLESTLCALHGGEDFELLFTLSQKDYDTIKNFPDIHVIGYCTSDAGKVKLISKQGNEYPLDRVGWGK